MVAGEVRRSRRWAVTVAEILRQRTDIEDAAGYAAGRTFCDLLAQTADEQGDEPAFSDRDDDGPWQTITWAQARRHALELAAGLAGLGLRPGERVALMLPNRVEHVLADLGVVHAGGVPVTFYSTLAADQVGYVAGDCDARIAVLDGAAELARWQPVLDRLPGLRKIIVRDAAVCPPEEMYLTWADFAALGRQRYAEARAEIAGRVAAIRPDDPVTVLYTSGTTGNPKGVVTTHRSVLYELAGSNATGFMVDHVRWVSYLPLAHIAERMFSIYGAVHSAAHIHFCHDAASGLLATLGAVRPTAFFGVPRVWEKIKAGIEALLAGEQDPARRAAVEAAMATGRRYVESCQFGRTTPEALAAEFGQADEAVLRPIRSLLGLGDAVMVSSAAAPLPPDVASFFAGLGLKILDVYGMTETAGAFTANNPGAFRLGTVGRALPGVEITIAPDGEILTRGPLNTPGYVNLPERTAELIDDDGWLHTGDIGSLDADGFLSVVDRKKELIITSGGENISPAAVENLLVAHPLIGQALSYGDRRPYVVALLTLDSDVAPAWARARGIEASSLAELAAEPAVLEEVTRAVAAANERLARVQQVKTWRLLPVEWTADSEELTPTLKLKRRVVHAKYADVIDALYAGPG
jgi:long-chain acyl-CoA synthetase